MTQKDLADRLGVEQSTVSRWERGSEPGNHYLGMIAKVFDKSPNELIGFLPIDLSKRVRVVGKVSAGSWREALEIPEDEQFELSLKLPDLPFGAEPFGVLVEGTSMNLEYDEGAVLVCLHLADMPRDMREGEHVIAIRRRGDEIEATCKVLRTKDGVAWLWPRSDDPQHQQPIVGYYPDQATHDADDGETAEIHAVVIGAYNSRL